MYLSRRIWIGFGLLFAIAVPWYWQFVPQLAIRIVYGLPLWVLTSVLGSLAISIFTSALLFHRWPDETESALDASRE